MSKKSLSMPIFISMHLSFFLDVSCLLVFKDLFIDSRVCVDVCAHVYVEARRVYHCLSISLFAHFFEAGSLPELRDCPLRGFPLGKGLWYHDLLLQLCPGRNPSVCHLSMFVEQESPGPPPQVEESVLAEL